MNRTVIAVVLIIGLSSVASLYVWFSYDRYQLVQGPRGGSYKLDRMTGDSWFLYGVNVTPHEPSPRNPGTQGEERLLPQSEQVKVTGNASLLSDTFSGKLYNGSGWTVSRLVVTITAKEQDDSVRWSRDYSADVRVSPLNTEQFSVTVIGENGIGSTSWAIKEVYGYAS